MSPRPILLATPIAAALLVALTACGASATAPSSATSAASSAGAAKPATTASAPSSAAASGPIDACKLVPAATVSKIMHLTYATAETSGGGDSSECGYDTKGISLDHLTLEIQLTGGKEESDDDQQAIVFMGEKPIALSGIGDSAYEAPEGSDARIEKAFGVLWGDTYATVGGPVEISESQARQLLTAAHDAL